MSIPIFAAETRRDERGTRRHARRRECGEYRGAPIEGRVVNPIYPSADAVKT